MVKVTSKRMRMHNKYTQIFYLISTHGIAVLNDVEIVVHIALFLGPMLTLL